MQTNKMTLSEYQKLAMRTSPDNGHDRIKNGCMGLIGEGGELMDVLKKWMFQSGENAPLPRERLLDELGDIMWYLAELATGLEKDLLQISRLDHPTFDMTGTSLDHMTKCIVELACNIYVFLGVGDPVQDAVSCAPYVDASIQMIIDIVRRFASRMDAKLLDVLQGNINKLAARYPEGFDPARSMAREKADAPPWEV